MPNKTAVSLVGALALFATSAVVAEGDKHDHDEHEHEEHAAHEHGSGGLNVVVDGNELAVELRMPGVNVVGFEHSPESDEDKAAIDEAVALFSEPAKLYSPNAEAGCEVEHGEARFEFEDGGHSELLAVSHFVCASPASLREMSVTAFDHLSDVEDLDAQVVTGQSQGGAELSPSQPVLRFGGS